MTEIKFKKTKLGIKYFTQGYTNYVLDCASFDCSDCGLHDDFSKDCEGIKGTNFLKIEHSGVLLTAYLKQARFSNKNTV